MRRPEDREPEQDLVQTERARSISVKQEPAEDEDIFGKRPVVKTSSMLAVKQEPDDHALSDGAAVADPSSTGKTKRHRIPQAILDNKAVRPIVRRVL